MIWITGDTHGDFRHIEYFAKEDQTTVEDVLICLGDSGINYFVSKTDPSQKKYTEEAHCRILKSRLSHLPLTVFCIHGNHEARAETVENYQETEMFGGKVWRQQEYPNLVFAQDGEVYTFQEKKYVVIGGAYSVDKEYRLHMYDMGDSRYKWFPDEQPDEVIKKKVEETLKGHQWKIHGILSHTAPVKYEPTELFLRGLDQSKVDKSTEEWLDTIEDRLDYDVWYFGHYHGKKEIDRMHMLFHEIEPLQ